MDSTAVVVTPRLQGLLQLLASEKVTDRKVLLGRGLRSICDAILIHQHAPQEGYKELQNILASHDVLHLLDDNTTAGARGTPSTTQQSTTHSHPPPGITWASLLIAVIQADDKDISRGTGGRRTGSAPAIPALKAVLQAAHTTRTNGTLVW